MRDVSDFQHWMDLKEVGEGAFGLVCLVLTDRGAELAAKYIELDSMGMRTSISDLILGEISVLRQLSHPNVVQFVTVKNTDRHMVVFTEFIDGKDLAAMGKLREGRAKTVLHQICSGLNYLHTRSPAAVLHRDIKGENIMVARDGTVKLIDFGLSINIMAASGVNISRAVKSSKYACGTLAFMAPELFNTPIQFSVKSDVWALGITIYQMMAGQLPFADVCFVEDLVDRITTVGAPPLPAGCSQQLTDFYDLCTAVNPSARMSVRHLLQHELFDWTCPTGFSCSAL